MPAKYLGDLLVDEEAMKPERCKNASINSLSHTPDGTVFCLPILNTIMDAQGKYSSVFLEYGYPIYQLRFCAALPEVV